MHIRRLLLANFRNYGNLDLAVPAGNLLFLGDNAQGKSNLLEAVSLLSTARSARAGNDGEMVGWLSEDGSQPIARAAAWVERAAGPVQVEAAIVGAGSTNGTAALKPGKRLRVNGIPRRAIDLVGQLRAVLFTVDDLAIVSGGPSERRRFLDALLTQLDRRYYGAIQRYARILQQRNAVLRRIKEGLARQEELGFWDESLVREGAVILSGRINLSRRLAEMAAASHRHLSGSADETLSLAYEAHLGEQWAGVLATGEGTDIESLQRLLTAAVFAGRRRDLAAGVSLAGPHRDDLRIDLDGVSAAAFGSRAQVRTASLALRLAEARLLREDAADPPVILLDDIVSELDERRRSSVLEGIADFDQVWLTATDTSAFTAEFRASAAVYRVESGRVSPLPD